MGTGKASFDRSIHLVAARMLRMALQNVTLLSDKPLYQPHINTKTVQSMQRGARAFTRHFHAALIRSDCNR